MSDKHYTEGRRYSHIHKAWILESGWNDSEEIAALRAQLAERDAEVKRLTHDIERHIAIASREADARIRAEAEVGWLREAIERAPCHDFCREAKARHYIPYTEHHHACWKVEALRLEGQDYMRPAFQGEG